MIVQLKPLYRSLLKFSSRISVGRWNSLRSHSSPRSQGYAARSPEARSHTILQDIVEGPASSCWSLLSPSSSVIASSIHSLKLRKAKTASGKTPLVVLLVTPAHIQLLDDSAFVPSLLRLAVETTTPWQKFDLLAAVIDRIPQTRSIAPYGTRDSHATDAESSPPRKGLQDGSEGISVAVLDSGAATPDLWSSRSMPKERETMTIQQRCTISFAFPPNPGVRTPFSDHSVSQPLVKRVLQLPVANTLFQNGKTSTLFAQRWNLQSTKSSTSEPVCSNKTWLPQQIIHMGTVFANEGMRLQLDHLVQSHLVPITPARTITAAMGNIVRKISGESASAEDAPASEELERAISSAIQRGQIPSQQAGVWALIRPQRYAALDRAAQSQGTVRDAIEYAVLSGGRLHKVLSGGGGWGEKHGLLSLDPDSDYSHHHRAFEPSFSDDEDAEAEKREALGEVAKPGDTITFFVYKSPSDAHPVRLHAPAFLNRNRRAAPTLTFGSLPSTMDAMPEVDTAKAKDSALSSLTVEENHFGMLSEQGMSLESSFMITNINANRMQYLRTELHKQAYEVRRTKTVNTKLDAPYTVLSIRGQSSWIPVSSEVTGKELQAPNMHLQNLMPQEPSPASDTTKSTTALVQKLPRVNDRKVEAQPSIGSGYTQAERVLTEPLQNPKEEEIRLTRKDKRAKKLEASNAQSEIANEKNRRITEEAKVLTGRQPELSEKVARKIAKKAAAKAANEAKQEHYRPKALANRAAKETKWEHSSMGKVQTVHQRNRNGAKTDDDLTFAVRFTTQEQGPHRKVILQSEAQDSPPITIKRHLSVDTGEYRQKRNASPEQTISQETKQTSAISNDSVHMFRKESEGKRPGIAYKGKDGNVFRIRRHATMNSFERLQEIQRVGEINLETK